MQSGGQLESSGMGGCPLAKFFLGSQAAACFRGCVVLPAGLEKGYPGLRSTLGFEMGARADGGDRAHVECL